MLVAIDGPGGSGKSTLAKELSSALDASVVEGDDFYRVMDESDRLLLEPEEGYQQYFDWERLRDEVLEPLGRGQKANYQQFDWSRGQLGASLEVRPTGCVLIEGVYSFRTELRLYYDFSILVDAPADERLRRLRNRGDNEAWIKRWMAAEDWYFTNAISETDVDQVVANFVPQ